jgi:hypothetical protein
MRNRLTRGIGVIAAAAAITTSLGFAAAGAASASTPGPHIKNATLVCGATCVDVSSLVLGTNQIVNAKGGATGTSLNLRPGGNTRVNEDFVRTDAGTVVSLCAATVISVSSYTCVHYGAVGGGSTVHAYELLFAPNNVGSGLCLGVSSAGVAQRVSLQACGTVHTFWVGDTLNGVTAGTAVAPTCSISGAGGSATSACPLLAASDTAVTFPLTLTVNTDSNRPMNVLRVDRETLTAGKVPDFQQYLAAAGPWVHS